MKSIIIIIHLCVLLLTFVSNGVAGITLLEILNKLYSIADEGGNINGVFQPSKGGLIGNSAYSMTYKGILLTKDNMDVSMKFTKNRTASDNEFKIYMKLGTFCNTYLEVYGVPSIHYYGMWGDCAMMAMTLFDPEYHQTYFNNELTETDLLILFREFMTITQYIHGRGVFHETFHLRHMMFSKEDCFVYEFINAAILSDGENEERQCATRIDYRKFIRAIYLYLEQSLSWSFLGFGDDDSHRTSSLESFSSSLKNDSDSDEPHKFSGLRRVLVEFARYALEDDSTPITKSFYDEPNRVIFDEIQKRKCKQGKKVIPSWLSNDQDTVQPSASEGSETQNRGEASSRSSRRRRRR